MNAAGIGSTTLVVNKAAVTDKLITDAEYTALIQRSTNSKAAHIAERRAPSRL